MGWITGTLGSPTLNVFSRNMSLSDTHIFLRRSQISTSFLPRRNPVRREGEGRSVRDLRLFPHFSVQSPVTFVRMMPPF